MKDAGEIHSRIETLAAAMTVPSSFSMRTIPACLMRGRGVAQVLFWGASR